jgi:glycosyltransferase involved in cell wall biosynthesis
MESKPIIPKFSIITATLNNFEGVAKTFASINDQEIVDFDIEWIVVDGMSSDGTSTFVTRSQSNSELVFEVQLFSKPPIGIYDAMNFGASKANGEYLLFLNSGDFFLQKDSLQKINSEFEMVPDVDCLALPVAHFTRDGFLYDVTVPQELDGQCHIHHQGAFLSRDLFQKIGGYDVSLKWAADGKMLDKVAQIGSLYFGKSLAIGFEIGGASAQNFPALLNEIDSYRRNTRSLTQQKFLIFKNWLKVRMILIHHTRSSIMTRWYYLKRQARILEQASKDNRIEFLWSEFQKTTTKKNSK